jgi:hypothetical protein
VARQYVPDAGDSATELCPAFDFVNRRFDIGNRCEILGSPGSFFDGKDFAKVEKPKRPPFQIELYGGRQQIIIASPFVDCAEAIEVSETRREQDMPGPEKVRLVWTQSVRIVSSYSLDVCENAQKARHVFRRPAVDDVEIHGSQRNSLEDRCHHANADEFDPCVSEAEQYLMVLRFDEVHGGSSWSKRGKTRQPPAFSVERV